MTTTIKHRLNLPRLAQRKVLERAAMCGPHYGCWWRAPYPFRQFAYYMCMRRCYGMRACEAYRHLIAFPGGAENFIINLREAMQK